MEQGQSIQSDAFRQAALRSERFRITGILATVAVLAAFDLIHRQVSPYKHDTEWLKASMTVLGLFAAYEGLMLWRIARAQRRGRTIPSYVWFVNTVIECSTTTAALIGLTMWESYLGPYRALVSPAVATYCFFIILSTLRLSPALSLLSGTVCAAGYIAVLIFTAHHFPEASASRHMPVDVFVAYPIALFLCGVLSAVVAKQIRRHVIAALAEAETRRKLDRIELELSTARSIQMGLLPRTPPKIAGYDIAGWSQPADQTGGDYYDWMELPGGKVLFTIADATGHGIGPALLVAACRAYFRAVATHSDPLEKITQQVDELLTADIPEGRFITAAIALLDPSEHRLSLYSAGHAPIYLYTAAEKDVTLFDADQPPLGTHCESDGSQARVIPLAAGDALILITDGFFECANPAGQLRGTAQLGESIRRHQSVPASELIAQLHRDVLVYSAGVPQADDMTAVVIKRV